LNQQSRIGDWGMTQDDKIIDGKISDIIDIDPDQVIENDRRAEPIPPAKNKRKLGRYGIGVAALALSAIAGAWFYKDVLVTYFPSDQIRALQSRIDVVEQADKNVAQKLNAVVGLTDELKSQLGAAQSAAEDARKQASDANAGAGGVTAKIAALEKSLGTASAAVDELKNKASSGTTTVVSGDSSGLSARVEKLEKELASLQELKANAKVESSQLSQSYADLKAKVAAGAEYSSELKTISALVPAAEGLDILTGDAPNGVLTLKALSENLKNFAATAAKPAEASATPDDSFWGKTTSMFSGLITIRNTGEVDWAPIALQGSALVDEGKLEDAVKLIAQNLNVMPQTLQDWRIAAIKRIAADQAVEQLGRAVTRQITARG
jgi:uncharacterized phage infection (PIP) family protein YhgE